VLPEHSEQPSTVQRQAGSREHGTGTVEQNTTGDHPALQAHATHLPHLNSLGHSDWQATTCPYCPVGGLRDTLVTVQKLLNRWTFILDLGLLLQSPDSSLQPFLNQQSSMHAFANG
jgi:hypothetical protein